MRNDFVLLIVLKGVLHSLFSTFNQDNWYMYVLNEFLLVANRKQKGHKKRIGQGKPLKNGHCERMVFQPGPIFQFLTLLNSLFYLKSISAWKCWLDWLDYSPQHLIAPVNTLKVTHTGVLDCLTVFLNQIKWTIKIAHHSRCPIIMRRYTVWGKVLKKITFNTNIEKWSAKSKAREKNIIPTKRLVDFCLFVFELLICIHLALNHCGRRLYLDEVGFLLF